MGDSSAVSAASSRKTSDIANLFSVLCWTKQQDSIIGLFGDRLIHPSLDPNAGVFENFKTLDNAAKMCGVSTEQGIFAMFNKLINEKIKVDTMIIFSDCQIGSNCNWYTNTTPRRGGYDFNVLFKKYREINPDVHCFSVDLKGYGTTVFNEHVFKVAGWSEHIFDIMKVMSSDREQMIKIVESIDY